jgi:methylated-DNA-protein-cysteine methyltransferase-like protein
MNTESAKKSDMRTFSRTRELEVLERVCAIPEGFVSTYGDVSPGAPRFAGTVLFHAADPDLPWWRVVRADGSLAKGDRQRALLRAEGVPFRDQKVDMVQARVPAADTGVFLG